MKVHDDLIPYLKGILKDPYGHKDNESTECSSVETGFVQLPNAPRNAYAFLSFDEHDFRKIAQLFRQEIDGKVKRKEALISALRMLRTRLLAESMLTESVLILKIFFL